jgi:hypothetical protein
MSKSEEKLSKQLNPQIRVVQIGTRELRDVEIFPLSAADQFKLSDIVQKGLNMFLEQNSDDAFGPEMIAGIMQLIRDNIESIIKIVAPKIKPATFMKQCTNAQLSEIIGHVWRDNYGEPVKNVMSLFGERKTYQHSERQSQPSQSDMDIPSAPSTETALSTEA